MFGPASEYADLIPRDEGIECTFHSVDADLESEILDRPPDFAVLDLDFLGRHADQLLSQLALEPTLRTIVTVTRDPSADSAVHALTSGARDYLVFSRDREKLAAHIERAVSEGVETTVTEGRELVRRSERLVVEVPPDGLTYDDYERRFIHHVLERHRWNRSRAARELGISRPRLLRKIKKYGLESS